MKRTNNNKNINNDNQSNNNNNNIVSSSQELLPVIETDLNCAINAISKQDSDGVDTILKKKHSQRNNKDEFNVSINEARETIIQNLRQITEAIPTMNEYENKYYLSCNNNDKRNNNNSNHYNSDSESSSEDDDSDESDVDEENLLDEDAFLRAKCLRADVRNSIQRVMTLRNEVPKLAVNLTLENIHKHDQKINSINYSNNKNLDDATATTTADTKTTSTNDDNNNDVSNMHQSLIEVYKTFQLLEETLPEKYEGLAETSNIIECSLKKYISVVKNNDKSMLSSIERAIYSKNNDGRIEDIMDNDDDGDDGGNKENRIDNIKNSPQTRLTRFMFS